MFVVKVMKTWGGGHESLGTRLFFEPMAFILLSERSEHHSDKETNVMLFSRYPGNGSIEERTRRLA